MNRELLSPEVVQAALSSLPGWKVEGGELVREFRFLSYLAGIEFVNRTARLAEEMNHHPDLHVGWRKVTARLTTHSAGGLTALDFDLARKMDLIRDY